MGDTLDTSAFRRGLKIEIDKEPWEIVEFQHVKPGKGSAFVRTRIKVFFRPKALRGDPAALYSQVQWKVLKQGDNWVAEGTNPTPYHMSFFSVGLGQSGSYDLTVDGGMVAPMGKVTIVLGEVSKINKPFNQIKVEYITDYGGANPIEIAVNAAP